jgi:type II secretion system protein H
MCRLAHHPDRARSTGFTLVELVMVMVIVGIISAIAVPRYAQALQRYRTQAAANRLAADLELARERARASSAPVTFELIDSTRYRILNFTDLDDGGTHYTVDLADEPYHASILASKLGEDSQIIFNGWGVPDSAGAVTVGAGKDTITVTLAAESGEVVVP